MLAEIAVWRSIKTILKKYQDLQREESKEGDIRKVRDILLNEDSLENYPRDIAFRMGDIYRNVVEICLSGDFGVPRAATDQLTTAFSQQVVDRLRECVI